MLVVDMINVDAYRFWAFPDLTSHFENTGIGVFWLHYPQDSKETELGNSDQEVSPSVLETCCTWNYVPTAISGGMDILGVPAFSLLWQMSSQ